MSQTGLTDFEDDGDSRSDRVVAEAKAIAGRSDQPAMDVVDAEDVRFPDPQGQVELMVTQVDYSIEGQGGEEYPVIHVFGRTAGNEAKHVRVLGFRPYFYAPTDSLEDKTLDNEAITGTEEGFQSIRGEALTRIYGQTPRDVGELRDEFDHYEADILFPNRFLIDKDINEGICVPARYLDGDAGGVGDAANGDEGDSTADGNTHGTTIQVPHNEVESTPVEADLRVNFFDIEVDDRSGFPEEGEEPIVCLSSHDSYRDEYIAWLYEAPVGDAEAPEALDGYGSIHDDTDIQVHSFDSEEAMLAAFLDYIDETDPDIASGWNFEDFDAPYLLDRLERLDPRSEHDLRPDRLSRIDEVWRSGWGGPNVKGRVVFDLLYAYKRTQFTELESYRLDAVAELELDVGKERYTGDLGDLWEQDPERLLEYNLRDVELCVEIDRKQEIIPFWNEVRTFVGCKLEDAPTPGDAVDVYVLHKVHGEFALPSKGKTEGEEYEGGAVFEPITGLKENVTVLDLKSLYPMCMVTINASPETKVDPEDYGGDTYRAPNGIHFRKEPDGIIRSMVDELLAEREQKKSQRNDHDPGSQAYEQFDRQQAAVKVIMNCFTPDTEVLTPDGIRNIRELDVGDEVYSLDPDSMEMEVKPVTETHAYPDYDRELVDIQTSNIDFRVTPNHRMLVRTTTSSSRRASWIVPPTTNSHTIGQLSTVRHSTRSISRDCWTHIPTSTKCGFGRRFTVTPSPPKSEGSRGAFGKTISARSDTCFPRPSSSSIASISNLSANEVTFTLNPAASGSHEPTMVTIFWSCWPGTSPRDPCTRPNESSSATRSAALRRRFSSHRRRYWPMAGNQTTLLSGSCSTGWGSTTTLTTMDISSRRNCWAIC